MLAIDPVTGQAEGVQLLSFGGKAELLCIWSPSFVK